jgi:hypothetical protein
MVERHEHILYIIHEDEQPRRRRGRRSRKDLRAAARGQARAQAEARLLRPEPFPLHQPEGYKTWGE